LRSMTGYGEKLLIKEGREVFAQIKTLNHRFLDISIFTSEEIPWQWEKKIEDKIRKDIFRGKVLVNLKFKRKMGEDYKVEPDFDQADAYINALIQLCQRYNIEKKIDLSVVLNIPEVIKVTQSTKDDAQELVEEAIEQALEQVIEFREKEGKRHLESILQCIERINGCINYIEKEIPKIQEKHREKVREELKKISEEGSFSPNEQIPLLLLKGDIEEEITRFHSHLAEFNRTLQQKGPVGKKLGFILQELFREINTIGAKSLSYTISEKVVQIKDDLEKIREQIYNIE